QYQRIGVVENIEDVELQREFPVFGQALDIITHQTINPRIGVAILGRSCGQVAADDDLALVPIPRAHKESLQGTGVETVTGEQTAFVAAVAENRLAFGFEYRIQFPAYKGQFFR